MIATITGQNDSWTVQYAGRKVSGFSSAKWAYAFCETLGLIPSDIAGTED